MTIPTLQTERLLLRPFASSDAPDLVRLAGAREVAATTLRIPHPYSDSDAQAFLSAVEQRAKEGASMVFAIVDRETVALAGAMGLELDSHNNRAELGYWVGAPYWGRGLATEAARALLRHGFEDLGLNRIYASHFAGNAASGKVLRKIGMHHEGCRRGHIVKWGRTIDLELYGVLRSDDSWKLASAESQRA